MRLFLRWLFFSPTKLKGGLKPKQTVLGISAQEFLCSFCLSLGAVSWPRKPLFLSPRGPTLENCLLGYFCRICIHFWLLSEAWHT